MTDGSSDSFSVLIHRVPRDALRHFISSHAGRSTRRKRASLLEEWQHLDQAKFDEDLLNELDERFGSSVYKFCHFFNFLDRWYDVYRSVETFKLDSKSLTDNNARFALPATIRSLKKIPSRIKVYVKLHHQVFDEEKLHLIVVELVSKSPFARDMYRYLFYPSERVIIAESSEIGQKILDVILKDRIGISQLERLPIRSLNVAQAANKYKTKKLTVRIDLETSGVPELHSITLEGDDLLEARKKLLARQEETLNFLNLGPWISVETDYFTMAVKKGIKLHVLNEESLTALLSVLTST